MQVTKRFGMAGATRYPSYLIPLARIGQ